MRGFITTFVTLWLMLCILCTADQCPAMVNHVYNGKSVWCHPVFNCGPGSQIIYCRKDGDSDLCLPCSAEERQYEVVSSLNTSYPCFQPTSDHELCPSDTTPTESFSLVPQCPYYCRCKYEECYYGKDPCLCEQLDKPCGPGQTMNNFTGSCVPCPPNTYKHEDGCGPCKINGTAWRLERLSDNCSTVPTETTTTTRETIQTSPTEVTSLNSTSSKTRKDSSAPVIGIVIGVVVGVLVLGAVILVVVCWRMKRSSTSLNMLFTKKNSGNREVIVNEYSPSTEAAPLNIEGVGDLYADSSRPVNAVRPTIANGESEHVLDDEPTFSDLSMIPRPSANGDDHCGGS